MIKDDEIGFSVGMASSYDGYVANKWAARTAVKVLRILVDMTTPVYHALAKSPVKLAPLL